ncbi:MAG: MacB family efflux pump subunit [Deltaproteobacteria bacterium]|jgi:macrolide transport system ATP-binding/permease protein|nr:MacB family efflux pump subunit [Deltaproteobacteria bacterium]
MNIIEIKKLNKFFGEGDSRIHVLRDIDLDVEGGDFVAIMGQSGSGQTTLMNALGCLDTPTSGSYLLAGTPTARLGSDDLARLRGRMLGFVFQRYNLLPTLSALENVALPAVYAGVGQRERLARSEELLRTLQLGDKLRNLPRQLSGGQQQRVGIARALMNGGQIILADEPSGALDSKSGEMVMDILASLHEKGRTVVVVTHDREIASRADRIVELRDGVVVSDKRRAPARTGAAGPSEERKTNPLARFKDQFAEAFKMSLQAVGAHKLRSTLTMMGIIIGIASVVSVVALGRGSQERIMANINSMGTNTITILPGTGFGDRRSGRVRTLTVEDSEMLARQQYLANAAPSVSSSSVLVYANKALNASLTGVGEQYFAVRGISVARGRGLTALDVRENNSVAVIDENTRRELFGDSEDPLGRVVIFRRQPLTIVGVARPLDMSFGQQNSLNLWAPHTTVMNKITGERFISSVIVKVSDAVNTQVAEKNIAALLTARHNGRQDFYTQNTDTIRQTIESTTATMTLLISSIALISLVVGGIGVMNIMLVSVTERTREIGVRMAVGARRFNILEQFLIEAVLLCVIGGLAGVALSGLVGLTFNNLTGDFHMSFAASSIFLALGCSSLIGVVFGYLPARSAARLNPIDALAHE